MPLANNLRNTVTSIRNIFDRPVEDSGDFPITIEAQKAVIPNFLYRPPFGRPRGIDALEVRRLSESSYVESIIDTITTEVCAMDWEIVPNDGMKAPDALIDEATYFFKDPNENHQNIKTLMRMAMRDILTFDSGIFNKVFDVGSYDDLHSQYRVQTASGRPEHILSGRLKDLGERNMTSIYVYDGITFTKNPSIHGVLPGNRDYPNMAYWQYYWATAAAPIGFNRDEVVWIEKRPRTSTPYGLSPVWTLKNVLYALILGEKTYTEYFTRNEIPPGVISLINANRGDIKAFRERMKKFTIKKDTDMNIYRRVFHTAPVINAEVKYVPFSIPPSELEWLDQQKWFVHLVWMSFGVTPSELGFTESSNRATELGQNRVFKRKAVKPHLDLLAYNFTSQILSEFGFKKMKIRGMTKYIPLMKFKFTGFDLDEELEMQKLVESQLRNGQITVNEWREDNDKDPVDWGNEPFKASGGGQPFSGTFDQFTSGSESEKSQGDSDLYEGKVIGHIKGDKIIRK